VIAVWDATGGMTDYSYRIAGLQHEPPGSAELSMGLNMIVYDIALQRHNGVKNFMVRRTIADRSVEESIILLPSVDRQGIRLGVDLLELVEWYATAGGAMDVHVGGDELVYCRHANLVSVWRHEIPLASPQDSVSLLFDYLRDLIVGEQTAIDRSELFVKYLFLDRAKLREVVMNAFNRKYIEALTEGTANPFIEVEGLDAMCNLLWSAQDQLAGYHTEWIEEEMDRLGLLMDDDHSEAISSEVSPDDTEDSINDTESQRSESPPPGNDGDDPDDNDDGSGMMPIVSGEASPMASNIVVFEYSYFNDVYQIVAEDVKLSTLHAFTDAVQIWTGFPDQSWPEAGVDANSDSVYSIADFPLESLNNAHWTDFVAYISAWEDGLMASEADTEDGMPELESSSIDGEEEMPELESSSIDGEEEMPELDWMSASKDEDNPKDEKTFLSDTSSCAADQLTEQVELTRTGQELCEVMLNYSKCGISSVTDDHEFDNIVAQMAEQASMTHAIVYLGLEGTYGGKG
jgi:hypothetical protein